MNNYIPDDLERNLIEISNQQPNQNGESSHHIQLEGEIQSFRVNLNYSMKLNLAFLFVYLSKIVASSVILIITSGCIDIMTTWIYLDLMDDILSCALVSFKIHLIYKVNNSGEEYQSLRPVPQAQGQDTNENISRYRNLIKLTREIKGKDRFISRFNILIKLYCLVLFIFGQIIIFNNQESSCETSLKSTLILSYIIFEYAEIFGPVISILIYFLVLKVRNQYRRRKLAQENENIINKLPIQKFSTDLPGMHQCSICMLDYNKNDNLIQFHCSPMHHFHEKCGKKWLRINRQCPICRTQL